MLDFSNICDYIMIMNTLHSSTRILAYLGSDDPAEIDYGIQNTIRGMGLSILAIGLGLAKIKADKLFIPLGHRNITAYIENLSKTTKSDRSNIFNWLRIGQTYLKYREELEKIGFTEAEGPTKLAHLERALAASPKDEVFYNLMTMSLREFKAYARSSRAETPGKVPFWEIRGNILYIEGQRAIILNGSLGEKNTGMLRSAIRAACRALERNGVIVAVHLNSLREARRFRPMARRARARIQGAASVA